MPERTPAITHVMQPVLPEHYALLTVGAMVDDTPIYLHRIKRTNPGRPGAGGFDTLPALRLKVAQRKEDCVTVDVPKLPFDAYAFSLSKEFDRRAVVVNVPRLDWTYPNDAQAGKPFRIVGRNIVAAHHYPTKDPANPLSYGGLHAEKTLVVARRVGTPKFIDIPVSSSSGYEARLDLPRTLKPGAYEFFAHNGLGGTLGWSVPLRVDVAPAEEWPRDEFSVDAYLEDGGPNTTADDAIAAALKDLAKNGGGVLKFGPHIYAINRTIVLPRFTTLRGAGNRRTLLQLPVAQGPKPPYVAITGDGDFAVEDVRIFSLYSPMLITAPAVQFDNFDDAFAIKYDFSRGKRARNVAVRRCHLIMRIDSHEDRRVDTDGGKYKAWVQAYMLSQGQAQGGFTAITFRGDGLEVEDNTIFGGGSCVMMLGSTGCRIGNNTLEIGPAGHGVYAMGHLDWPEGPRTINGGAKITGNYCKNVVIEDNRVSAYSQTARDGVYLMYGVEKSHVARNHISNIESTFDAEGLGLHLWSGRWNHAGLEMVSPGGTRGRIIDPKDEVKYECLDDAQIEIVGGHGVGQLRRIVKREGEFVELDQPWAYDPDVTSEVVYTAPPLFNKVTLVDNTIFNTGANLIMWGCSNDCVVDGNRLADGPHLSVWSVRVQGDQKVWGGAAFVSVINNVNEMGWIDPPESDVGSPGTELEFAL